MRAETRIGIIICGALLGCVVGTARGDDAGRLIILPQEFTLHGPELRHRLLVETSHNQVVTGQVREGVEFHVAPEGIVRIEQGVAVPVGNGTAEITAKRGEQTATAQVTVKHFEQPHQWSFRNHVQSVLSKTGCNSGACHGALAGKKGFKLSLRGY